MGTGPSYLSWVNANGTSPWDPNRPSTFHPGFDAQLQGIAGPLRAGRCCQRLDGSLGAGAGAVPRPAQIGTCNLQGHGNLQFCLCVSVCVCAGATLCLVCGKSRDASLPILIAWVHVVHTLGVQCFSG